MTYPRNQIVRDMVPSFVEFQKSREGRETIGQCVSRGMQRQESEFGQPPFVNEDICERRIANGILQLEDGHLPHRLLLRAESRDQFGDIYAIHGSSVCEGCQSVG
jgi:hypothetical protein